MRIHPPAQAHLVRDKTVTPELAKRVYDIGFRAVGVNVMRDAEVTDAQIREARTIIEDAGLVPAAAISGVSILRPDPAEMALEMKKFIRLIGISGKLGCNVLQASGGSMNPRSVWSHHRDTFSSAAMDAAVANARKLAPVAEDNNLAICPETTQWTVVHHVPSIKEFVDRVDSPGMRVAFDFVNHMTPERVFDSGNYMIRAVDELGDRVGMFHVKDVKIDDDALLVVHISEAPMGTGLLDHEALIRASGKLEPWKPFSLEHIRTDEGVPRAYDCIQSVARRIGHEWTNAHVTRRKVAA